VSTALVTGASSGIGEATARRLDRDGWRIVLVARREDRLRELAGSLKDAAYVAADLTDEDAPERVREHVEGLGELHLLVNNAGRSRRAPFGDREEGGYALVREVMDLNFDAVLRLTEQLLPIIRESAPSAIVNVGSIAGRVGQPKSSAYNASKFALAGWTEALRFEERRHGVHVGLVLPGYISTEGFPQEQLMSSARTRWTVSTPDKVADAIVRAATKRKPEVHVPRPWAVVPRFRAMAPRLWFRVGG
jgi:short-subunit dehydrogenase